MGEGAIERTWSWEEFTVLPSVGDSWPRSPPTAPSTSTAPEASVRTLPDAPTFADPKRVIDEHCFQDYKPPDRYAYVKVISDSEVAVVFGDGACPASLPDDYEIYHR